jgi:hypothetical protein
MFFRTLIDEPGSPKFRNGTALKKSSSHLPGIIPVCATLFLSRKQTAWWASSNGRGAIENDCAALLAVRFLMVIFLTIPQVLNIPLRVLSLPH